MKQKTTHAKKLIGYDNNAPTARFTLLFLGVALVAFLHLVYVPTIDIAEAHVEDPAAQEARLLELKREAHRQAYLAELRFCESSNDNDAVGDGGASNGPYQVQETTLEDWLGKKVSTAEYYSIVTDLDAIHPIVYEAYFEKGESWRWKICTKKINAKRTWVL